MVAGKALNASGPGEKRPYLRTKNVFDGRIDLADVLEMPFTATEFERYQLRHGDVLLNEGQSLDLVGRCAMYRSEYPGPCAIQNQLIRFRAKHGVSPEFAEHLLSILSGYRGLRRNRHSDHLRRSSRRHPFSKLELSWPRRSHEQEAIAEALSDADALIESLERLIAKKRDLKQGVMQELLTGKRRLPGFERALDEADQCGDCSRLGAGNNGFHRRAPHWAHLQPFGRR